MASMETTPGLNQQQIPPSSAHDGVDSTIKPLSAIDRIKPQLMDQQQTENNDGGGGGGGNKRNSGGSSSGGTGLLVRGSSPRRGSKDLLASAGINIERRRGSQQTPNYRIEKNQVTYRYCTSFLLAVF
jgi:hypothetical protein